MPTYLLVLEHKLLYIYIVRYVTPVAPGRRAFKTAPEQSNTKARKKKKKTNRSRERVAAEAAGDCIIVIIYIYVYN